MAFDNKGGDMLLICMIVVGLGAGFVALLTSLLFGARVGIYMGIGSLVFFVVSMIGVSIVRFTKQGREFKE